MDKETVIKTGRKLPFENLRMDYDGCVLEFMDLIPEFVLIIGYQDLSEQEIKDFKNGEIKFRYLCNENFMVPLMKIGDNYVSLIFDPYLYSSEKREGIEEIRTVNMIVYDRLDRIVEVIRRFKFDNLIYLKWLEYWRKIEDLNQRGIRFRSYVSQIETNADLRELWTEAHEINISFSVNDGEPDLDQDLDFPF